MRLRLCTLVAAIACTLLAGRLLAAGVSSNITALPAITSVQAAAVPESQASKADAPVRLDSSLVWDPVYVGDPLRVRLRVVPMGAPDGKGAETAKSPVLSRVPADWANRLRFTLYKLGPTGGKMPVVSGGDWKNYQVVPKAGSSVIAASSDPLLKEWTAPADLVRLTEGSYLLQASWKSQDLQDAFLLGHSGRLVSKDLSFSVKALPESARLQQLRRLAWSYYLIGRWDDAIKYGREAIEKTTWDGSPEQIDTYTIVADSLANKGDGKGSVDAYKELLAKFTDTKCAAAIQIRDSMAKVETKMARDEEELKRRQADALRRRNEKRAQDAAAAGTTPGTTPGTGTAAAATAPNQGGPDAGYDDGYDYGYDDGGGYDQGYDDGYDNGY